MTNRTTAKRAMKHGHCTRAGRSPEHRAWKGILLRCDNPKTENYPRYGGRGITVCDRWRGEHGFENFLVDMGPRPTTKHEIDRFPDNDGNYEPGNCRWATHEENQQNTSRSVRLTFQGRTQSRDAWARELGMASSTLFERLTKMSVDEALSLPVRSWRKRS